MSESDRIPADAGPIAATGIGDGASSTIVAAPGVGKRLALWGLSLQTDQFFSIDDTTGVALVGDGDAPYPAGRLDLPVGDGPWQLVAENRGIRVTNRAGAEADLAIAGGAVYKTLDV